MEIKEGINIEDYNKAISSLANTKDKMVFSNGGAAHAACVMSNIFKTSEKSIQIFAGNLNGDISNDPSYMKELESFINRGGQISLLLENKPEGSVSKAFNLLNVFSNLSPDKIKIKFTKQCLTDDSGKRIHFTVGDSRMYRFETDTEKYTAICSFNNENTAKMLLNKFNELFEAGSTESLK